MNFRSYSKKTGRSTLYFILGFCILFLLVGLWQIINQKKSIGRVRQAPGEIIAYQIESVSGDEIDDVSYRPVCVYRYHVNEINYVSKQVTPLLESSNLEWASNIIFFITGKKAGLDSEYKSFPAIPVTVYYDPHNPAEAFLIKRESFAPYLFLLISYLLLALFVWFVYRDGFVDGRGLLYPAKPCYQADLRKRIPALVAISMLLAALGLFTWAIYDKNSIPAFEWPWIKVGFYSYFLIAFLPFLSATIQLMNFRKADPSKTFPRSRMIGD